MNCPKCGIQNPDDAQVCASCGSVLTQPAESVNVKTSRLAIAALVLGVLSLFSCGITAIPAIIFGIIGYVKIEKSGGRLTGRDFAIIGIVLPIVILGIFILFVLTDKAKEISPRFVCGSNLSGIGRAMIIYANDYDNKFPRAGGRGTIWQPRINNWQADNRTDAFGLKPDGTGGSATISSSLFLLVKYAETTPKSFVCPSDRKTKPFKASDYGALMYDEDAWDFGPESTKHCSYSYHMCYGPYPLSTESSDPGQAVAADRNPWLDPYTDTTGFQWDDQTKTGGRENIKGYQKGNSGPHQREGQNVLFMDNHVYFEKASFCGVNDDNIYTYWNGPDIRQGAPPVIGSQPKGPLDSLLVNDPPLNNFK